MCVWGGWTYCNHSKAAGGNPRWGLGGSHGVRMFLQPSSLDSTGGSGSKGPTPGDNQKSSPSTSLQKQALKRPDCGLALPLQHRRSQVSPSRLRFIKLSSLQLWQPKGHTLAGHNLSSHERDTGVDIKMSWKRGATRQSLAYEDSAWGLAVIYRHMTSWGHMWSPMFWERVGL